MIWDPDWKPLPWMLQSTKVSRSAGVVELIKSSLYEVGGGELASIELLPNISASLMLSARWKGREAFIKVHTTDRELFWIRTIDEREPGLSPEVFMSGKELTGVDVNWLVLEHLPYSVNTLQWEGNEWRMMAEAAARFQHAVQGMDTDKAEKARLEGVQYHLRWLRRALDADGPKELLDLTTRAEVDWAYVAKVCPPQICFGDLHFGNALSRTPPPGPGKVVLVDPIPRVQPWIFDAVYCQTRYTDRDVRLANHLADAREQFGMASAKGQEFERATKIMSGWAAAQWWGKGVWRRESSFWVAQTQSYIQAAAQA